MKKRIFVAALNLLFIATIVLLGYRAGRRSIIVRETRDTLYVESTIHDTVLLVKHKTHIRVDTCYLAVADSADSADSVHVEVPIEQKTYETENYKAVIEGYRPQLISMDIYQKTKIITVTKEAEPRSRWHISFAFGATTGIFYTPAGWQPGVGAGYTVGIAYNF